MKDETGAECDDIVEGPGVTTTPEKAEIVPDCVCPACYKPMAYPRMDEIADRYGRVMRRYFGFCPICSLGNETVQFKRDGRWVIHKYQVYAYVGQLTHCRATGRWVTLNDLPEPAPVVTGPEGREYDKQITLTKEDVMLVSALRKALESFAEALGCFMHHFGLKE
jgi:hypothetical protein